MHGGLLCGCGSQTSFLNHGRHRPSSVKQLYPPVPLSSTCIWLKYSAWLPALPCMYNYRICCLPLITLPNNVWRGRRRWIPNEVWKRLIKIAMVKSQRTSVCSALADQGRWEDRLCAWDSKLFFLPWIFGFYFGLPYTWILAVWNCSNNNFFFNKQKTFAAIFEQLQSTAYSAFRIMMDYLKQKAKR